MKTLATGVAALPNLEPAPRFLAEVRRKIARAEKLEPMTWQDYIFRPLWLKVPLEAAALILIVGLIMRSEHPQPRQLVAQLKSARTENNRNEGVNGVSSETAAKVAASDALKIASAEPAPPVGTLQDVPAAPVVSGALLSHESLDKKEKSVDGTEAPGLTIAGDTRQFVDKSMPSGTSGGSARRIPMVHGEASSTPLSGASPMVGVIRSIELAQSQLSETVTVHARDFNDVRNRAQQLAARCSGRVVVVPQSKDATEQTLFVELPQEYVAAFKLELLKTPGSSGSTNAAAPATGVLTGSAITNNSINAPGSLGLRDDTTTAPNTVLEIRVFAPVN